MAVIAIDFDHTMFDGDTPLPHIKEAINLWREHGHKVIINSCNDPKWIEKCLNNHDIRYDHIWTGEKGPGWHKGPGKVLADIYIDDKSYRYHGDWGGEAYNVLDLVNDKDNRKW